MLFRICTCNCNAPSPPTRADGTVYFAFARKSEAWDRNRAWRQAHCVAATSRGLAERFISRRGFPFLIANWFYPGRIACVIVAKCSWQFFGYATASRVIPVVKVNVLSAVRQCQRISTLIFDKFPQVYSVIKNVSSISNNIHYNR